MKKKIYIAAIVLFALIFLVSAYFLISYFVQINRAQKAYDALADLKEQALREAIENAPVDENGVKQEPSLVTVIDKEGEPVLVLPEYAPIFERNKDLVGWIRIEDTVINYPVVQTPEDPEYYLHRNFEGEYEYSGLPFIDGSCTIDPASTNIIIYGHNMKNSTMFSRMLDYKSEDFYKEHPYITFNTIYGDGTYEIVAVVLARALYVGEDGFRYYGMIDASSKEEFDDYMANIHALELYDTGVTAEYGDQLLTLSTCEYSQTNGRMAIIAKKIQ